MRWLSGPVQLIDDLSLSFNVQSFPPSKELKLMQEIRLKHFYFTNYFSFKKTGKTKNIGYERK